MDDRFVQFYLEVADRVSQLSRARRLQVGSVIVKDHRILSYGYNGTPAGFDNNCEDEVVIEINGVAMMDIPENRELKTKPEVIHSEINAILKVAKSHDSTEDATMFLTHSPCMECAKAILQSGIKKLYFRIDYRSHEGVELLRRGGVVVERYIK